MYMNSFMTLYLYLLLFFENGACISYLAVIYLPYLTSPFLMSETYKNVAWFVNPFADW